MEVQELLQVVTKWHKYVSDADKHMNKLNDVLDISTDSPFSSSIYLLLEAYTTAISEKIGDYHYRLSWYMYDNEFGKRRLTLDRNIGRIDSLEQLTTQIAYDIIKS